MASTPEITAPTITLTPPDPVPVVAPAQASGLVPVAAEVQSKLEAKVDAFVADLVSADAASPEFGQKVDQLTNMGRKEIAAAAGMSNRFLDRPVKAMDKDSGVGTNLVELRRTIEALDPKRAGKLSPGKKLLGIIPFGNSLQRYFDNYTSAQGHIKAILDRLASGKDELLMDNAAIDVERGKLWEAMGQLEQMIHISRTLDAKLEEKAAELDATDPAKAKAIRESALFYTRQRTQDLLTQMAVSVQGYLALDLVKKNNVELVKGVERASTTTVGALRTAATPISEGPDAGLYRIAGTKIFITWGEHDLASNIIHLVLARTPGAPAGSRGISLFIVPKFRVNADGSLGPRNDLRAIGLEHKLGIHASPTCVMSFGEGGNCIGELIGRENEGLKAMFTMMNAARINVGNQGVQVAEAAGLCPAAGAVAPRRQCRQGPGGDHRAPRCAADAAAHAGADRGDPRSALLHCRAG